MDRLMLFDSTIEDWVNQHLLVAEFSPMKISTEDVEMSSANANRLENVPSSMPDTNPDTLKALNQLIQTADTQARVQTGAGLKETTAALSNKITARLDNNPNRRPIFPGEKHMVLPTKYGYSVANYAGPGTRLAERLARGDPPVDGGDGIDAAAQKHDIDYANAKDYADIKIADDKFIKRVQKSDSTRAAKALVTTAMKAKAFGEKIGIINKNYFSGLGDATNHTVPTSTLVQGGKGRKRPRNAVPGDVRARKRARREIPVPDKAPEISTDPKVGQKNNFPSIYNMVAAH